MRSVHIYAQRCVALRLGRNAAQRYAAQHDATQRRPRTHCSRAQPVRAVLARNVNSVGDIV